MASYWLDQIQFDTGTRIFDDDPEWVFNHDGDDMDYVHR